MPRLVAGVRESPINHYPHHIGDYLKDTAHLDPLEDGIYRRMLDLYYTIEGPLEESAALCRRLRLDQKKHGKTMVRLLEEFFVLNDQETHWHHTRCDAEIAKYKAKADANRRNGKAGGRPKQTEHKPTNNPSGFQEATQPITQNNLNQNQNQNQEPEKEKRASPSGSRLSLDALPPAWYDFAMQENVNADPSLTFAKFSDYWKAQPGAKGRKADWDATWRNWVRREKEFTPRGQTAPDYSKLTAMLEARDAQQ